MNAIRIPQEKAIPRITWGKFVKRFANGYKTIIEIENIETKMVSVFVNKTKIKPRPDKIPKQTNASDLLSAPLTNGRVSVLFTPPSIAWSAKSFMQHPAERITIVPARKIKSREKDGSPSEATKSALIVGQRRRYMPMGRFSLVSSISIGIL